MVHATGSGSNRPEVMDESKGPGHPVGPIGKGEETIMSVDMAKKSDANPTFQPGAGMGHGDGEVKFIGGFPTERIVPRVRRTGRTSYVSGAVVRVCGLRIDARPVHFLDINGASGTQWITANGERVQAQTDHTVGDWFRFLLDAGTFAGVVYYR